MARRDFDVYRQQRRAEPTIIRIGGRDLMAATSIRPEVVLAFSEVASRLTGASAAAEIDNVILQMLAPQSRPVWEELRRVDGEDVITLEDMLSVCTFLLEAATGHPTPPSSPSSAPPSGTTTGTPSTDGSSPPGIPAVLPPSTPAA